MILQEEDNFPTRVAASDDFRIVVEGCHASWMADLHAVYGLG